MIVRNSHLVELYLPVKNRAGEAFAPQLWSQIQKELVDRFGGLTSHNRAPAEGIWNGEEDDIVIVEVMCKELDETWWRGFRERLERQFEQERILVRATPVHIL